VARGIGAEYGEEDADDQQLLHAMGAAGYVDTGGGGGGRGSASSYEANYGGAAAPLQNGHHAHLGASSLQYAPAAPSLGGNGEAWYPRAQQQASPGRRR
jgi:hypothetical protein